MCSIRNQSQMGTEGTSWNLRSEGYEMGLAKGRAFSAKRRPRSVGHFRVGSVVSSASAIPKKMRNDDVRYVPFIASHETCF